LIPTDKPLPIPPGSKHPLPVIEDLEDGKSSKGARFISKLEALLEIAKEIPKNIPTVESIQARWLKVRRDKAVRHSTLKMRPFPIHNF
jgi:hypothetical protein